jgi:hypothetical protein
MKKEAILMDGTVQICRGFNVTQWKKLNSRLIKPDGRVSDDETAWHCAIEVFERRMRERFLSPIDALEAADSRLDLTVSDDCPGDCSALPEEKNTVVPGFAIVALCCLLAETLQAFRSKTDPPARPKEQCSYPDGPCIRTPQTTTTDAFKALLRRPAFRGAFEDDNIAASFVHGVRNGILHEAETRKWVIWRSEPENQLVAPESDGYALNRSVFYKALKDEFAQYVTELRDSRSVELRVRFRKKMNDISKEA